MVFTVSPQLQMVTELHIGFGILGIFQPKKGILASAKGSIDQVDQVAGKIQGSPHKNGVLSVRIPQLVKVEQIIDPGDKLLFEASFQERIAVQDRIEFRSSVGKIDIA